MARRPPNGKFSRDTTRVKMTGMPFKTSATQRRMYREAVSDSGGIDPNNPPPTRWYLFGDENNSLIGTDPFNFLGDRNFWFSVLALVIGVAMLLISANALVQREVNKVKKAFR